MCNSPSRVQNMHLRLAILTLGLVLSSLVLLTRANPLEQSSIQTDDDSTDGDVFDFSDFEDDDSDSEELLNSHGFNEENVNSVTHLHRKRSGEILVPCFGMWWPVGGPVYDYGGDYYGDYKRKRRRSRKQKKAAKMKKKKS